MINTIEVIRKSQLNDQGSGNFTVNWPVGKSTVLSIQPDGSVSTRPAGTAGPYETCQIASNGLVYTPAGTSYLVPYAE